jgi:hypothetical protein
VEAVAADLEASEAAQPEVVGLAEAGKELCNGW